MRILIFENNDENLNDLCLLINMVDTDISIDKTIKETDILRLYKTHSYDIVFINCNNKIGIDLKNQIREINTKQKIIVVNNGFHCSEPNGCSYCKANTNTLRIFEPYTIVDIINSFKDVKCKVDYCNSDIQTKLIIISKQYKDLVYNEDNNTFSGLNGKKDIISHSSIVNLATDLTANNINFTIEENLINIST